MTGFLSAGFAGVVFFLSAGLTLVFTGLLAGFLSACFEEVFVLGVWAGFVVAAGLVVAGLAGVIVDGFTVVLGC
jgi:hypothetical protein